MRWIRRRHIFMDFSTLIEKYGLMQLIGRCNIYSGKYGKCTIRAQNYFQPFWGKKSPWPVATCCYQEKEIFLSIELPTLDSNLFFFRHRRFNLFIAVITLFSFIAPVCGNTWFGCWTVFDLSPQGYCSLKSKFLCSP